MGAVEKLRLSLVKASLAVSVQDSFLNLFFSRKVSRLAMVL